MHKFAQFETFVGGNVATTKPARYSRKRGQAHYPGGTEAANARALKLSQTKSVMSAGRRPRIAFMTSSFGAPQQAFD